MSLPIRFVVRCRCSSRLRLLSIAAAATLCFIQFSCAATFTAGLDRDTITLGERATLSLTFSGATPQSPPTLPEIPGLQIDYVGQSKIGRASCRERVYV